MRARIRRTTAVLGLMLAGCATMNAAPGPEARKALAPTGTLRTGLVLGSPTQAVRDATSGEMRGVGFDLGRELARRLDVQFEPVLYPSIGALLDAGRAGGWDVAFIGFSPARAKEWDYAPVHLEVEFGYLVPGGAAIGTLAEADRPGIRVAVQDKSLPEIFLSRTVKHAQVIRAPNNAAAVELVRSRKADAFFSIKPNLFAVASQLPGSRVLDGRPGIDPHAMALPKGREVGLAYARQFIEDAKATGLVKAAIERAGLRGVVVGTGQ
jgi:polar amino acid transport system substrate-binding protein